MIIIDGCFPAPGIKGCIDPVAGTHYNKLPAGFLRTSRSRGICLILNDFQDVSVFTISSEGEFPWTINAVLMLNCAHGFNSPKFHTTIARTFFPGLRNGAISMLSKDQCPRSARAGPKQTAFPFTNSLYLLSAEM